MRLLLVLVLLFCSGCGPKVIEWGDALDHEYSPAHTSVNYIHTGNGMSPITQYYPASYYIWYSVVYEGGEVGAERVEVSKEKYDDYIRRNYK